ncbi:hypothetical protein MCUN1_002050 [Malassezia cuniculi]|uniref:REJ domain-containing protein n=1 Tax=Malassezia cuniculi TaxID=948313 RepID=A0AAF0ERH5_9BASI|nr:hypothetical protein MCUN1_002050 [Malassezia cuniculi]
MDASSTSESSSSRNTSSNNQNSSSDSSSSSSSGGNNNNQSTSSSESSSRGRDDNSSSDGPTSSSGGGQTSSRNSGPTSSTETNNGGGGAGGNQSSSSSEDNNSSSSSSGGNQSSSSSSSESSSSSGGQSSSSSNQPTSSDGNQSTGAGAGGFATSSSSSSSESSSSSSSAGPTSSSSSSSSSSTHESSSSNNGGAAAATSSRSSSSTSSRTSYSYSTKTDVYTQVTEINGEPHTSTYTVLSTNTIAPALNKGNSNTSGFFNDSGAVGGTFAAVGIVALAIILALAWLLYRRRKAKRMDAEVMAAASAAAATTRTPFDDDEHDYVNDHSVANAHNPDFDASSPMMREYYASPYEDPQYPAGHYPGASGYAGLSNMDPFGQDNQARNAATDYLATARGSQPGEQFYDPTADASRTYPQSLATVPQSEPIYHSFDGPGPVPGSLFVLPQGHPSGYTGSPMRQPSDGSAHASSMPHAEYTTVNEHLPQEYDNQFASTGGMQQQMPVFNGQHFTLASGAAGNAGNVGNAGAAGATGATFDTSAPLPSLPTGAAAGGAAGAAAATAVPTLLVPATHNDAAAQSAPPPSDSVRSALSESAVTAPSTHEPSAPAYSAHPPLGLSNAAMAAAAGPEKAPLEEQPAAVAPPLMPSAMPYLVGTDREAAETTQVPEANQANHSLIDFSGAENSTSLLQPFEQSHSDGLDGPEHHSGDGDWDPPALSTAWFPQATTEDGDVPQASRPQSQVPADPRLSDQRPYPYVFGTEFYLNDSTTENHSAEAPGGGSQNNV